jgi:hypothetical protein
MNTIVARVLRVLTGHSPTAMIHAIDEHGHEHKLEVPVESTRDATPGRILVLQWSVHGLPEAVQDNARSEVVSVDETSSAAAPSPTASVSEGSARGADSGVQLEALLGLRPGRLGEAGPSSSSSTQSLEETFGIRLSGEPRRT